MAAAARPPRQIRRLPPYYDAARPAQPCLQRVVHAQHTRLKPKHSDKPYGYSSRVGGERHIQWRVQHFTRRQETYNAQRRCRCETPRRGVSHAVASANVCGEPPARMSFIPGTIRVDVGYATTTYSRILYAIRYVSRARQAHNSDAVRPAATAAIVARQRA